MFIPSKSGNDNTLLLVSYVEPTYMKYTLLTKPNKYLVLPCVLPFIFYNKNVKLLCIPCEFNFEVHCAECTELTYEGLISHQQHQQKKQKKNLESPIKVRFWR